jgi:hypothetical protein
LRTLRAALCLALAIFAPACARRPELPPRPVLQVAAEPRLGATLPVEAPSSYMTLAASAQTYPSYLVRYKGLLYEVGIDPQRTIQYILMMDANFKTPEGIRRGSSLADVLATGAKPLFHEPGWGCHTQLPSGWRAAFPFGDHQGECGPRVEWLFQRES